MGYRSDFELYVEKALIPYDKKEFIANLEKISDYTWEEPYSPNDTELQIQIFDVKWYNVCEHLLEISEKYPDLCITCHAIGEDREEIIYDAFNGQIHQRDGEMTFPPRKLWT